MKVLLLGGTHPRHLSYLHAVAEHGAVNVVGAVLQHREHMTPPPPAGTREHDARLWTRHFAARDEKEAEYFGAPDLLPDALVVAPDELNGQAVVDYVRERDADLALIFGCGMIRGELFEALPDPAINMHLGLSPRYRGAATLFWPFYHLEPNHAGVTFHKITAEPDAGEILHQSAPYLAFGDTIHDVACRAVGQATEDMLDLLNHWPNWAYRKQKNTGKCFLARDFQPAHLRLIYDVWHDDIVNAYLAHEIRPADPVLYQENLP